MRLRPRPDRHRSNRAYSPASATRLELRRSPERHPETAAQDAPGAQRMPHRVMEVIGRVVASWGIVAGREAAAWPHRIDQAALKPLTTVQSSVQQAAR